MAAKTTQSREDINSTAPGHTREDINRTESGQKRDDTNRTQSRKSAAAEVARWGVANQVLMPPLRELYLGQRPSNAGPKDDAAGDSGSTTDTNHQPDNNHDQDHERYNGHSNPIDNLHHSDHNTISGAELQDETPRQHPHHPHNKTDQYANPENDVARSTAPKTDKHAHRSADMRTHTRRHRNERKGRRRTPRSTHTEHQNDAHIDVQGEADNQDDNQGLSSPLSLSPIQLPSPVSHLRLVNRDSRTENRPTNARQTNPGPTNTFTRHNAYTGPTGLVQATPSASGSELFSSGLSSTSMPTSRSDYGHLPENISRTLASNVQFLNDEFAKMTGKE